MNAGWLARQEGWGAQLDIDGRIFNILDTTGTQIGSVQGLFAAIPPLDPNLALGNDLREYSTITILTSQVPATIAIDFTFFDTQTQTSWVLRKRVENDADFTTEFWVTKKALVDA
jgi:hypothetical protein